MVVSSGFAEAGEEGRALQEELRETALRHRLPVLGPNVEGFVNYVDRVAPYGTSPPPEPVAGSISVISQSGTVAWAMNQLASDRGAGLRHHPRASATRRCSGSATCSRGRPPIRTRRSSCTYIETMRDVDGHRSRAGRAPRRAQAGPGLRAGGPERGRAPIDRGAHRARSPGTPRSATRGSAGAARSSWRTRSRCSRRRCCLSFGTRLRTDGVAAALQSGGACTLFAEAAGAQGLSLPEFSAATKRKLRKALPHYASQNNPLDVTGQAAVETDMFCRALDALARDPAVGFVAFDAFPPREEGEDVWAEPVLQTARRLRKETGVVFASVAMGPLGYGAAGKRFVGRRAAAVPPGAPRGRGRDPRAGRAPGVRARGASRTWPPHPNRGKALRLVRGESGPLDEAARGTAARALRRAAARGAGRRVARGRGDGRPRDRVPGGGEGARAGAAAQGEARRRPARPRRTPPTSRWPPPRSCRRPGGPAPPRRGCSSSGWRRAPRCWSARSSTSRSAPASRCGPAGRWPRPARRRSSRRPSPARQALAFVARAGRACALSEDRHDLRAVARAVEAIARAAHDLRGRLDVARGEPAARERARRGRRRRAGGSRASGVIYGLVAALGFGLADFEGAIAGRRIGSLWTVILGQTLSADRDDGGRSGDGRVPCPSSAR